jgi:hypothetical protein
MSNSENVGHCGRIFLPGECCDECKLDDLCDGCCMNDDESQEGGSE